MIARSVPLEPSASPFQCGLAKMYNVSVRKQQHGRSGHSFAPEELNFIRECDEKVVHKYRCGKYGEGISPDGTFICCGLLMAEKLQ